jgi:hypothetical protein
VPYVLNGATLIELEDASGRLRQFTYYYWLPGATSPVQLRGDEFTFVADGPAAQRLCEMKSVTSENERRLPNDCNDVTWKPLNSRTNTAIKQLTTGEYCLVSAGANSLRCFGVQDDQMIPLPANGPPSITYWAYEFVQNGKYSYNGTNATIHRDSFICQDASGGDLIDHVIDDLGNFVWLLSKKCN